MSVQHSNVVPNSRWREVATGRVIIIIDPEVYGTGPSWRWEDGGKPGEINWHYCNITDFFLWKRFELLKDSPDNC